MRNRGLRTKLTLLLSLAVLLVSVTPPSLQHAHPEGDCAHHHRTTAVDTSGHRHDHGHAHDSCEPLATLAPGVAAHTHLLLFGFDFYLALAEHQDAPQEQTEVNDQRVTLVRFLDSEVILSSRAPVQSLITSPLPLGTFAPAPIAGTHRETSQTLLASLPLCDSARGERSGVQLI